MSGPQTFQRLSREALEEHRQIHFFLDQVAQSLARLEGGITDVEPMRRLAAQLAALKDRLQEHHQHEESGGLFEAVLEALPSRRVEIDRLANQHERMIEILEMARLHAKRGEVTEFDALRVDLQKFLQIFREHEQHEEMLLAQAIGKESREILDSLKRPLNGIFVVAVLVSVLLAAHSGRMPELTSAILDDARKAVEIALKLVGVMAFFLGLMKVAEEAGLLRAIARRVSPLTRRLFPSVPPDHPAMSAIVLNIASNMLGLGNAATPFGIRAMEQLDELNGQKGTATNAMALFLAINTAGLALLPLTAIALRAAAGSQDAAGILLPTWLASAAATTVGIVVALVLARLPVFRRSEPQALPPLAPAVVQQAPVPARFGWRRLALAAFWLAFLVLLGRYLVLELESAETFALLRDVLSHWMLPGLVVALVLYGWSRRVRVYDTLVEGAKEGFQVALRIIPFLVAVLVAVGMFRASGAMALIVELAAPVTTPIGLPAEALPMAILRPLSGSGAMAVMVEAMNTYGPDSLIGYMVSTIQGSTETTFYVLAVYCGAVGIKRLRHTLPACLAADVAGILAAVWIVQLLFGA